MYLIKTAFATSTIDLPAGFTDNILSQATSFFGSFSPYVILVIGLLMAVVVIEVLIGALRR